MNSTQGIRTMWQHLCYPFTMCFQDNQSRLVVSPVNSASSDMELDGGSNSNYTSSAGNKGLHTITVDVAPNRNGVGDKHSMSSLEMIDMDNYVVSTGASAALSGTRVLSDSMEKLTTFDLDKYVLGARAKVSSTSSRNRGRGTNSQNGYLQDLYSTLSDLNKKFGFLNFTSSKYDGIGLVLLAGVGACFGFVNYYNSHESATAKDPTQDESDRRAIIAYVTLAGVWASVIGILGIASKMYVKTKFDRFNDRSEVCGKIRDKYQQIVVNKSEFERIKHYVFCDDLGALHYGIAIINNKQSSSNLIQVSKSECFCIKENYVGDFNINEDTSLLYYIYSIKAVGDYLKVSFFPVQYMVSKGNIVSVSSDDKIEGFSLYIPFNDISYTSGDTDRLESVLTDRGFSEDKHKDTVGKETIVNNGSNDFCFIKYQVKEKKAPIGIFVKRSASTVSSRESDVNVISLFPVFFENTIDQDQARPNLCRLAFNTNIDKFRTECSVIVGKKPLCSLSTTCVDVESASHTLEGAVTEREMNESIL